MAAIKFKLTPRTQGYIAGIAVACGSTSLYQDYLGKEAYLASVAAHWTSWVYTVPPALLMLVVGIVLLIDRKDD